MASLAKAGPGVILGVDPAWGETGTSGVALIRRESGDRWEFVTAASSYALFCGGNATEPAGRCNPALLLQAADSCAGRPPDLVLADIPLATVPITGRRAADDAVSAAFGGRWASAHSPGPTRPGVVGTAISDGFRSVGYPLATTLTSVGTAMCLLETYPHPALITLLAAERRLPYKVAKRAKYWPGEVPARRLDQLKETWRQILAAMGREGTGITLEVPTTSEIAALKRFEDALDALVTCWVGVRYVAGRAVALGDDTAAIWLPA